MGEVIDIGEIISEKHRGDRERMESALLALLERVRSDELVGLVFVAIPNDRQSLSIGLLKYEGCGIHEMIGASTMLQDFLRDASRDDTGK